jgi:hypothetical protein
LAEIQETTILPTNQRYILQQTRAVPTRVVPTRVFTLQQWENLLRGIFRATQMMLILPCLVHVSMMSLTSRRHRGRAGKTWTMLITNQSRHQRQFHFPNLTRRRLPMLGKSVLRADPLRLLSLEFSPLCSFLYPGLSHVNWHRTRWP